MTSFLVLLFLVSLVFLTFYLNAQVVKKHESEIQKSKSENLLKMAKQAQVKKNRVAKAKTVKSKKK